MIIDSDTIKFLKNKIDDSLILVDKPVNWSSFDVVKKLKNLGRFKKIGHAGTLDPFATGLLILGTGKQTKKLSIISNENKAYIAKIAFGQSTDTYDKTGQITTKMDISSVNLEKIKNTTHSFLGDSEQIPPMFSAKKVGGVRLYKLARKGKNIERKPQQIHIYEMKILDLKGLDCELFIKCSKGTYIRSIANDFGNKTGYGAYLKELRRVSIDQYSIDKALTISEFEKYFTKLN